MKQEGNISFENKEVLSGELIFSLIGIMGIECQLS